MNFSVKKLSILLTLALCLVFTESAMAVKMPAKAANVKTAVVEKEMTQKESRALKKQERKAERFQKRIAKFEKKMKKRRARGQDDASKWLLFWLLGWGAGILLLVLSLVALVGLNGVGLLFLTLAILCFVFGGISLVVWLVKSFS